VKKYSPYIFLSIAIILFIVCQLQKIFYSADDTFIYMQYARNIANGDGFSFNPGEPSYGVTSPLWVLIISISYLVGLDGFWFARITDLIFALCSVFCFYKLSSFLFRRDQFLTLLSTSIFILNVWFIRWSFTGMETNLAVCCVLLVFYFYYKDSYNLVFFTLGVLYLVRPEGLVLFLVIFFTLIFEKHKFLKLEYQTFLGYVIIFLIVISPFLAYSKITFGTIISNTTIGKATFNLSFSTVLAQIIGIIKTLAPSSAIEIILSLIFIIYSIRKKTIWIYTALWLWPPALVFLYIIADSDIISRYLLIIIPVFTLLAIKSIEASSSKQFLLGTILFLIIVIQSQFVFYKYVKPHTDSFTAGVYECMIPIGKWFSEHTPPDSRILVNDVGAIGYYSDRYIIDAAALINRDLELNKKIMQTPLEERKTVSNLLEFVDADYLVERDSIPYGIQTQNGNHKLEFLFYKTFPGLGISDNSPRYYKVFRVHKIP
jgi:arabinofuranosyltransferase